jgi:pyruvate/2-oxoglutarate/acetoin dehydrogenase E1 component
MKGMNNNFKTSTSNIATSNAQDRRARVYWMFGFDVRCSMFHFPRMSITYLEAIREAQAHALRDDPRVFIYGQDVGAFGGAFKATKNLAKEFPGRVIDSPISEDAMIGLAVGAAIEGMRPIIEMQFADFSTVGFNQIVNQAATLFWRTQRPLPDHRAAALWRHVRAAGRFTARALEAIYAHYPGLVVMTPATVEDAYSMLLEAVAIDDPVIFCEHKFLYYHLKAEKLPSEALPVGKARIAREGRDLTIVAYSAMVHEALEAATELVPEGWEMEVVDLRSVKPLDTDTVMASVARTGRLLCVGEAWPWGGVTAEVIARVTSEGFGLLDVPPQRLNAKDTPVPYHPNLWTAHRPTARAVAAAARKLLRL